MKIRKELWFGFSLMAIILAAALLGVAFYGCVLLVERLVLRHQRGGAPRTARMRWSILLCRSIFLRSGTW